jgi:hypothetical protein
MAGAVWNERTSRRLQRELGAIWGVEPSTIRNYSAEAGRSIRDAIVERRAAIAQRAIDRLERIAGSDMSQNIVGLPSAMVHANEVLLKVSGFAEPADDTVTAHGTVKIVISGPAEAAEEKAESAAADVAAKGT